MNNPGQPPMSNPGQPPMGQPAMGTARQHPSMGNHPVQQSPHMAHPGQQPPPMGHPSQQQPPQMMGHPRGPPMHHPGQQPQMGHPAQHPQMSHSVQPQMSVPAPPQSMNHQQQGMKSGFGAHPMEETPTGQRCGARLKLSAVEGKMLQELIKRNPAWQALLSWECAREPRDSIIATEFLGNSPLPKEFLCPNRIIKVDGRNAFAGDDLSVTESPCLCHSGSATVIDHVIRCTGCGQPFSARRPKDFWDHFVYEDHIGFAQCWLDTSTSHTIMNPPDEHHAVQFDKKVVDFCNKQLIEDVDYITTKCNEIDVEPSEFVRIFTMWLLRRYFLGYRQQATM